METKTSCYFGSFVSLQRHYTPTAECLLAANYFCKCPAPDAVHWHNEQLWVKTSADTHAISHWGKHPKSPLQHVAIQETLSHTVRVFTLIFKCTLRWGITWDTKFELLWLPFLPVATSEDLLRNAVIPMVIKFQFDLVSIMVSWTN